MNFATHTLLDGSSESENFTLSNANRYFESSHVGCAVLPLIQQPSKILIIETFAARQNLRVVGDFYDAAVSGADAIADRPGFAALLDRIENNGVRTVIVEDVSRFAREMKAHVLGIALLRERGVRLFSASDGQNLTEDTDEMTEGMVTIMAVFAQIEKKRLVKKLKAARDRKSKLQGRRIEGRKGYRDTRPDIVRAARSSPTATEKRLSRFVGFQSASPKWDTRLAKALHSQRLR